jgi:hypothetical protein
VFLSRIWRSEKNLADWQYALWHDGCALSGKEKLENESKRRKAANYQTAEEQRYNDAAPWRG